MEATIEQPPQPRKTQRNQYQTNIDWNLIAGMYAQGLMPAQIAVKTGVKVETISVGISRRGFTRARKEADRAINRSPGERLKGTLGTIAQSAADHLALKTPKNAEKLNLHVDSALKTAKLGATIYGWDSDRAVGVIAVGIIGDRDDQAPEQAAIEVESVTQADS